MSKQKSLRFFMTISVMVVLVGGFFLASELFGQATDSKTVWVDFPLGGSKIVGEDLAKLKSLGDTLKADSTLDYLIVTGVDSTGFVRFQQVFQALKDILKGRRPRLTDEEFFKLDPEARTYYLQNLTFISQDTFLVSHEKYVPKGERKVAESENKSNIENAALMDARAIAAARAMDIQLNGGKVEFRQKLDRRFVRVSVFRKKDELASIKATQADLSQQVSELKKRILPADSGTAVVEAVGLSESSINLFLGWSGLSFFDGLRDLAGAAIGLRWNTPRNYFVELYGAWDPAQRAGYLGKDARDALVGGSFGYYLKRTKSCTLAYKAGLVYGQEFTTVNNKTVMEVMGATIGLEASVSVFSPVSLAAGVNALVAEVWDIYGTKTRWGASVFLGIILKL
jgi:hypothetical protein